MSTRGFARGYRAALRSGVLFSASIVVLAALCPAPAKATTFNFSGFTWQTDRADTGTESIGSSYGRDDVLDLGILPETTSPSGSFYQYEGYNAQTNLPVGSSFVSADLYIPASWETGGFKDVAIWALLGVPPTGYESYPTLGFYKDSSTAPASVAIWDFDHNELLPSVPINYDGWNTFRISYLAGNTIGGGEFEMFVNGALVATMANGDFTDGSIDPTTAQLYEMFLDQGTSALSSDPNDSLYGYDVFWSNIIASLDEQYYNAASLGPAAVVGGEMMLGTYTDRRGLDWDSSKYAWAHVVDGVTKFDDGAGTLTSNIAGVQYGQDVFALGDPSTRIGVTFGYTNQSDSLVIPAGTSANSSSNEPAIGAYITHADSNFYADLLGQYRFLDFDATSPTSEGHVKGGSVDLAAEAGVHWKLSNGVTLTPMGQLLYEHVNFNEANVGYGLDASFADTDALIARARMTLQDKVGAFAVFGSVGVSDNLLGDMTTAVTGNTFETNIGGAQGEFVAGFDGELTPGFDIFASGEFDTSFDGESQSYLGQAGLRTHF